MECEVTFVELTRKTIVIKGNDIFDIMGKAEEYTDDPSENIDFSKNFDDYEVCVTKIKEVS